MGNLYFVTPMRIAIRATVSVITVLAVADLFGCGRVEGTSPCGRRRASHREAATEFAA